MSTYLKDPVVAALDDRIEAVQHEAERLRGLRDSYLGKTPKAKKASARGRRRARQGKPVDARKAAGGAAIDAVETLLREVGRTLQSEIATRTGLNSGTVSHALAVLEQDGKIKRTGRTYRRSPEWGIVETPVEPVETGDVEQPGVMAA